MGMLRASAAANGYDQLDLRALADSSIDSGLPGSIAMLRLVDAAIANDEPGAATARADIDRELGPAETTEVAAVIGNFEMMNRIADGTGTPMSARAREYLATELETIGLGHVAENWGK